MEGVIRRRVTPRTAMRIHRFLTDKQHVTSSGFSTILKTTAWAESIQAGGHELAGEDLPAPLSACDLIQQTAENLIEYATGIERQLLSKSLQEALFSCLGFNTNLTSIRIKTRLKRFFDRHPKGAFTQRFLALYFFNCIWFYTEEGFSGEPVTSEVFEEDMKELDRICKRVVLAACKHADVLHESAAENLIRNIEQRLKSFCRTPSDKTNAEVHQPLADSKISAVAIL